MTQDPQHDTHVRLVAVLRKAETDATFRDELRSDPSRALGRFNLDPAVVSGFAPGGADDDPGCADGTCWVSMCPDTCYVTVCTPSGFSVDPGAIDEAVAAVTREAEAG